MDDPRTRREFLHGSVAGLAGASLAPGLLRSLPEWSLPESESRDGMPYRPFGRSDRKVSLFGVGGYHIGMCAESEAIAIIREALDNGVNFLDNSWCYHDGGSETRMGKALASGYREKAFLMSKVCGREKKVALEHLEDTLRRLKTDHLDLWMCHECVYDEDPDRIFASGGAIEALDLAKQQGKVRHVGFTGHKKFEIHLKMLAYEYPWDASLLPINPLDGSYRSFEKWVLPVLVQRGIAPLAMKTRASGAILAAGLATVEECWRYAISLPVATVVSGMESLRFLRKNIEMARTLEPMSAEEREAILARTRDVAMTGERERFKTTRDFDGAFGRTLYPSQG